MPSHDVNAKTPRRRGATRDRTAEHADHAEITAPFEVHNAEPPKGGTTYLKCQRAAEAWSVSATEVAFVRSTTVVVFSAGKFSAFARGELARRLDGWSQFVGAKVKI